jgi:hypothetical protein
VKLAPAILLLTFALSTTIMAQKTDAPSTTPDLPTLQKMTSRFAPTDLTVNTSKLSAGDKKALAKLVQASRVIDDIFLTQYWNGNHALYSKLKKDITPLGKARLDYFWINKSPWSALDGNKAFLPGVPPEKLPGANFYPEDMTRRSSKPGSRHFLPPTRKPPSDFSPSSFANP